MRPLQILTNKYITRKQELEFQIEAEINSLYPNVERLDYLFEEISKLNIKNDYLTQLLIDISHARNSHKSDNQSSE